MSKLKKIETIQDINDHYLFAFWYFDELDKYDPSQTLQNMWEALKEEGFEPITMTCGYTPDLIECNYDGTETHIPFPSKELPCCWVSPLVTEKVNENFWSKKF